MSGADPAPSPPGRGAEAHAYRPGPARRVAYAIAHTLVRIIMPLAFRARSYGSHNVPRRGPALLISNHQSYLDPVLIGGGVPHRPLDFLARRGLFASHGFGRLIGLLSATPVAEQGGDAAAMREVLRRLAGGRAVLVFPEGSRTPDGRMQPFKRGVLVLLRRARCPVVPVAVAGCFEAWPRHAKRPVFRSAPIAVEFGPPIPADELAAMPPDAALARLQAEVERLHESARARLPRRQAVRPSASAE